MFIQRHLDGVLFQGRWELLAHSQVLLALDMKELHDLPISQHGTKILRHFQLILP